MLSYLLGPFIVAILSCVLKELSFAQHGPEVAQVDLLVDQRILPIICVFFNEPGLLFLLLLTACATLVSVTVFILTDAARTRLHRSEGLLPLCALSLIL